MDTGYTIDDCHGYPANDLTTEELMARLALAGANVEVVDADVVVRMPTWDALQLRDMMYRAGLVDEGRAKLTIGAAAAAPMVSFAFRLILEDDAVVESCRVNARAITGRRGAQDWRIRRFKKQQPCR